MKERVKPAKKDGDNNGNVARPVAPSAEERGLMQVAIPIETHRRAKAVAKVRGRSLGEYVDEIVRPAVERDEKEIAEQFAAMTAIRAQNGSIASSH